MTIKRTTFAVLAAASLAFSPLAFAATDTTTQTTTNTTTTQTSTEPDFPAHLQNFTQGSLKVQFYYLHTKLSEVRFTNISTKPIRVTILDKSYVLGPNDQVVVNPPKVEYLHVMQQPFTAELPTFADNVFKNRFSETYLYKLPGNTDSTVSN